MELEKDRQRFYDLPEEDRKRLAEILAKIESLAIGSQLQAGWRQKLTRLKDRVGSTAPLPSKEERLTVYQSVRDAGVIPEEATFFLIAYTIEWIAEDRLNEDFQRRMKEAEKASNMEEFNRLSDSGNEENLREAIIEQTFRKHGEDRMADLFVHDREKFNNIREAGRQYFYGQPEDKVIS